MLNLRDKKHLCKILKCQLSELQEVVDSPKKHCKELVLRDPSGQRKDREVLHTFGTRRVYQNRLHKLFADRLNVSPHSHGSVRGRSIKTNAIPHCRSRFILKTDISAFYPSISYSRAYRLFVTLNCSPDVARLLTQICTYDHHLALGIPTSPILADQLMAATDRRIAAMCKREGLIYTRYVDDIAISGQFDMDRSGIPDVVETILGQNGFKLNRKKQEYGATRSGLSITGIRAFDGKLDTRKEYLRELHFQLDDAQKLIRKRELTGLYYTKHQIHGRVNFVCWLNPHRARPLRRRFNSINWNAHREEAQRQGLEATKPQLIDRQLAG